jgi:flavin-dependent dehydrogenase
LIDADVAIIGAGVAGCIASIALAPSHRVLLIDREAMPAVRIGESLPPVARRILQRLDLLDSFNRQHHLQSQGMQSYWGSEQPQMVDQLLNPDGFGWHLDRQAFEIFLREAASLRGVKTMWPAKIASSQYQGRRWLLSTETENAISVNYVIDAGGRQSHFARQLGFKRQQFDKLIACWATLPDSTESRLGTIAAVEDGWWYSAPIPNNRRVIAFQADSDLVESAVKKNMEGLLRQAQNCAPVAELFSAATNTDSDQETIHHGVRSANSSRLGTVAGEGWAALGDAALSFDPLSSQGMYNAMASAMQLVELLQANNAKVAVEYSRQIEKIWQHYRRHQTLYYQQERRWQQAAFWQRRH